MIDELFSDKNVSKVLKYFLVHEMWEQNQLDLCENLKIYQQGMRKALKILEYFDLIKISRQIAKSKFYSLNKESKIVRTLRILNDQLATKKNLKLIEEDFFSEEKIKSDEIKEECEIKNE